MHRQLIETVCACVCVISSSLNTRVFSECVRVLRVSSYIRRYLYVRVTPPVSVRRYVIRKFMRSLARVHVSSRGKSVKSLVSANARNKARNGRKKQRKTEGTKYAENVVDERKK